MTAITNDAQFREALKDLSLAEQRDVGARFVKLVASLTDDDRVEYATRVAVNKDATGDELAAAHKAAKAAALDSHTRCGADADWSEQAGYFVARAASAIVVPEKDTGNDNPAWNAAMSCRMARTCTMIESNIEAETQESEQQYRVLEHYINP